MTLRLRHNALQFHVVCRGLRKLHCSSTTRDTKGMATEHRTAHGGDDMLLDNKTNGKVGETLRRYLQQDARLSCISSAWSVYAFAALKTELSRLGEVRLLLASPASTGSGSSQPGADGVPGLTGSDADRRLRNSLNLAHTARQCAQWLENKAQIRMASAPVPQNLFHIQIAGGQATAIHGSSNFTTSGLGFAPSNGFDMNTLTSVAEQTRGLMDWFNSIWNDAAVSAESKARMLNDLKAIYGEKSPELVYFLTLYSLFHDLLTQIDEDQIIRTRTGIKDTLVWRKLYRFQRDGILGAIDKIEKYNGCIIADSVGLGKTFEALAIIKYYELRNDRVLVLCPKKLRENWTIYTVNDKRNIFAADRFNFDVLNHTDLTRNSGHSGEVNLASVNWGNYDLVVIDESHNFRNSPKRKDGLTRYTRLMQDIIKKGVKTKVLMLSATPVNNRMNDLKNQVAFITEGVDTALTDHGIASMEQTLRKAQTLFNQWLRQDEPQRTAAALLETLNFDYFKLLDLLTIARSRKHIEKYYNMAEIGAFPERARPINIKSDIDTEKPFPPLKEINQNIRRLNLSAYAPLKYVLPHKLEEYSRKYDIEVKGGSIFKQVDREESLIHLMRVSLFKRMESSINSFAITLRRLLDDVRQIIGKLEAHDQAMVEELKIEDIAVDDDEFEPFLLGKKVKVLIGDVDRIKWLQELREDEALLGTLLADAQKIDATRDAKLRHLKDAIVRKCRNPTNPGNRKLLIFTAYADTAQYLYRDIAPWAGETLGLHCALVTGRTDENQTTLAGISRDSNSIITSFSPLSKERSRIDPTLTTEIDILIATDCISEGQNLQDCDYVVNYDIHWNPVRIIQRFGRIDRIGSKNKIIQLVNFWPNMELDEYINLEARVSGRMVLLDISATGEENIIQPNDKARMNDLEYRRRQLQQLQESVVNLEDLANNISITDLTLNDFRMDLAGYLKNHGDQLQRMPIGAFAVTPAAGTEIPSGVIFCLRTAAPETVIESTYALSPYYLVFVSDNGQVVHNFPQTKKILDLFKKLALGQAVPDAPALATFNAATRHGADMEQYQSLLGRAVAAITGKADEKGIESLFQPGGTVVNKGAFAGTDDFEVVSYLIILPERLSA